MSTRPSSPVKLIEGLALSADRHAGFVDTFNWMCSCLWHLSAQGIKLDGIADGRPVFKIKLEAGPGVKVSKKSEDTWRIALSGQRDDDEGGDPSSDTASGGGGQNPGGSAEDASGGGSGGGRVGGDGGTSSDGGSWGSGTGGAGVGGSLCNTWSDLPSNDDDDPGMRNPGDDCSTLNGW